MRIEGKVALITGAGAGLGRVCAQLFSAEGAAIVAVDVIDGRAQATADMITKAGGRAIGITADVTVEEEVAAAINTAVLEFGKLDVLHNNAGIDLDYGEVPFEEISTDSWNRVLEVNLTGPMLGAKHAVKPMRANGGGSIIMTSSIAGIVAMRGYPAYCASKAALNGLVRSLALELGPFNIRVNAICPMDGMSLNFWLPPDAEVQERTFTELMAESIGGWDPSQWQHPLKVPRPPQFLDNAYAALFLASDETLYMSGVCFQTADAGTIGSSPIQADGVKKAAMDLGAQIGALRSAATA